MPRTDQKSVLDTVSPRSRVTIVVELVAAGLIIAGHGFGVLPISSTPYLFALGWLSLRRRSLSWREIGLDLPSNLARRIGIGCVAGVALFFWGNRIQEPFFDALTGRSQDLSQFDAMRGNLPFLIVMLLLNWTLAAFGEEMVYRGFLMNRLVDLFGDTRLGWGMALVGSSLFFSSGHVWQGVSGVLDSGAMGLLYGGLYLASGRNLWVPVFAHGVNNTIGLILLYAGQGP